VDEAVQLAQDVVRDVPRGARLAVQVDRDVGVLEADLLDELAQVSTAGSSSGPGVNSSSSIDRMKADWRGDCCCANCDRSP
jgi:hypothetical protein